jgi:caffeoyl-CoA O-methyltransferase
MKEPGFLKLMAQKFHAKRVLEIGTFDGTSALALAEAIPDDGTVITCEINPGLATLARKRINRSPHGRKVDVRDGPALKTLPGLTGPFDLIFIDADTANYVHYYHHAMARLAPAGVILMDNMRGATLGDVDPAGDPSIAAVQELRRTLASDSRVTAELMSVRDGVMVITSNV